MQIHPAPVWEALIRRMKGLQVAQLHTGSPHRGHCAALQPPNRHKVALEAQATFIVFIQQPTLSCLIGWSQDVL